MLLTGRLRFSTKRLNVSYFQKDRLNFNFEAEHYLKNGNSDVCGGAAQSGICLVTDEEEAAGRLDTKHATLLSGKIQGAEKPQLETSTLGNEQHFCCFHLNLPKQVLISPFVLFLYPDEEIKYKCICLLSKISSSNHSMGIKAGGGLLVFFLSGSVSWSAIISSLMEISSKVSSASLASSSSLVTGSAPG